MASLQVALLVLLMALLSSPAAAQSDDASRATARELSEEGGALYQEGKYAEALEKLDKAYAILKVPTIGYWSARCLEQLGRLVEASERYLQVTRLTLPEGGAELHERAQADAADARKALVPRIPRLRIALRGAQASEVSMTVDGAPVAAAIIDVALPVNPGEHRVVATRGSDRVEKTATLEEGREARVEVVFEPKAPSKKPPPQKRAVQPRSVAPDRAAENGTSGTHVGGYVAIGIGAAALVTGIITGSVLLAKNASLDDSCVEAECSARSVDDVDTYNALRPTTTVTLSVGAAAVAAGLVFVLAFP